jgi:hypothetical protein
MCESVEIRYKRIHLLTILVFVIPVFSFTFYANFYVQSVDIFLRIATITFCTLSLYVNYSPIKKIILNDYVLKISHHQIEIKEREKSKIFYWNEIKNWKIEYTKGDDTWLYVLILETFKGETNLALSNLDKDEKEIEDWIKFYSYLLK